MMKAVSSIATFLLDSSVFDLPRMLWNPFFCQLFIGEFNYSLNLISLNLNSGNMTDHLNSSPALAGAGVKASEGFFHFSHRKKKNQKRQNILFMGFLFFLLKDRKGVEKMLFSSKERSQQVCPVGHLGAGWFFKAVFWQQSCPEAFTDLWVRIWQHSFQRCSSGWRVGGSGEGGGHLWEWLPSISHCQWKDFLP